MGKFTRATGLRMVALAALLALIAGAVYAQDVSPCPLGGYSDPDTPDGCTYGISINVSYPDWLAESEAAQTGVNDILTTVRNNFFTDVMSSFGEYFGGASLDVMHLEFEHGAALRSVVFPIHVYLGGAHGSTFYRSLTVDTIANRALSLEGDIFLPDSDILPVLQPLVIAQLVAQQGEYADIEWITQGTDDMSDYGAWAINTGNLELFFGPYQVAPYAMGTFQVSIPADDLYTIINPMLIP